MLRAIQWKTQLNEAKDGQVKFDDQTSVDRKSRFLWGLVTSHRIFQMFWVDHFDLIVEVWFCCSGIWPDENSCEDFAIGIRELLRAGGFYGYLGLILMLWAARPSFKLSMFISHRSKWLARAPVQDCSEEIGKKAQLVRRKHIVAETCMYSQCFVQHSRHLRSWASSLQGSSRLTEHDEKKEGSTRQGS